VFNAFESQETFMKESLIQFWQNNSETIIALGYNVILATVILIASSIMAKAVRKAIQNTNSKLKKLDPTLIPIFSTVASYAVYLIGGVFILDIFGVNTASLIALVGAAGLAIGLALKDTLSNIAAGIMLLILRPFNTGDFIEFGGTQGTVREINLFTCVLETVDGLYIASPNSVLWGNNIKNFTRNGKRRMDIIVGISYSDSIDEGFAVLQKIAENEPRLLSTPAPQIMVASMMDSAVNIQFRAWANNDDYWPTYWDLNKRIKESIEAAGLTIPFPQRTLHLVGTDPISLNKNR
jgi:small conductance mechanosensitive channel